MPKISELNAITSVANTDLMMVVHDPGGSPSTNKITVNNFITSVSSQLRGYTGSGGGYTGSAGASGYAGSAGTNGYTGSAGTNGYTGSSGASGIPGSGYSAGYVLSSNSTGGVSWQPNPDVVEMAIVDQFGNNVYYATSNDTVIIVDPTSVSNNVTVILPLAAGIEGKRVTVKNVSTGGPGPMGPYGYTVTVTTTNPGSNYIEHPVTGNFVTSYELKSRADGETWIRQGDIYRHVSSEAAAPIFYVNANTYAQLAVKNISSASEASADAVMYNDLGDIDGDAGPYVDIGINSSGYNNPDYNIGGPSDSYVYNKGGNLTIGTANTGTSLILHTDGTTSDTIRMVVNSTAVYVNATMTLINTSPGASPEISSIYSDTNLVFTANSQTFKLSTNGSITFPDNTSQNTAFTKSKTLTTISVVGPTTITNDVTFADPNAAGANVNLILPSSPPSGRVYTVKNINAGGSVVYVQTNGTNNMENEAGSIGSGIYATISTTGDFITWIYDGGSSTYRIIG